VCLLELQAVVPKVLEHGQSRIEQLLGGLEGQQEALKFAFDDIAPDFTLTVWKPSKQE
jgi:hypothetical protein